MADQASVGELFIRINGTADGFIDQAKQAIGAMAQMDGAGSKLRVGMLATASIVAGAATAMLIAIDAAVTRSVNKIAELGKTAQQIGVPVEQLSLLDSAAKKAGLSSDELSQAIKLFARNAGEIRSAIEPADAFQRTLDSLQVKLTATGGAVRPTTALILELADKFSRMPDGVQKSRMAMELFGRTGTEMIPFLNQGPAAIQKWMEAAEKMGPVTKEQADAALRFNNSLRSINNSFDIMVRRAVLEYLPTMEAIASKMNELVKSSSNLEISFKALSYLNPFLWMQKGAVEAWKEIEELRKGGDKTAEGVVRTTNSIKAGMEAWKTTVVGAAGDTSKGVDAAFKPMEKTAKQVAEEFAKARELFLDSFLAIRNGAGQFVGGMRPMPEVVAALDRALRSGAVGLAEYDATMAKAFGIHRAIELQKLEDVMGRVSTSMAAKVDALTAAVRNGTIGFGEFDKSIRELNQKKGLEDLEDVLSPIGAQKSAEEKRKAVERALKQEVISERQAGQDKKRIREQEKQDILDTMSVASSALTTMFKDNKAAAIGSAIINTAVGVTKALSLGPPMGFIQAGLIAAAGAAQVAAISSASSSGGSVSTAAAATPAASAAPAAPSQTMFVSGFKANEFYSGEAVKNLAQKFLDFQRDGGQLVLT